MPFQAFAGEDLPLRRDVRGGGGVVRARVRARAGGGGHGPHRSRPLHVGVGIAQGALPRRIDDVGHGRRRRLDGVPRHRDVPPVERIYRAGERGAQASGIGRIVPDGIRTHREMGGQEGMDTIEIGF